jgi:hypothetical protein
MTREIGCSGSSAEHSAAHQARERAGPAVAAQRDVGQAHRVDLGLRGGQVDLRRELGVEPVAPQRADDADDADPRRALAATEARAEHARVPGKQAGRKSSLTSATYGAPWRSLSSKPRPRSIGIPSARK